MSKRITDLFDSGCSSDVRHFVVLVLLMLHNGKANIEDKNKDMVPEICQVFKVENFPLFLDLQHEKLEQCLNTLQKNSSCHV